ncbi:DUF421 domain-containing protein [Halalkalibacter krulwichiae]|nr:YetF domain-containing protein [Halalkalibacter krulwichiae]
MFIVGLTAFRLMGSQAVGRLTDFDLVVAIAIGALIAKPLSDPDLNLWISVVAILALVIAQIVFSWLSLKSIAFERIVAGKPIKVIENGSIIMKGLHKARLSKNELNEELRVKGFKSPQKSNRYFWNPMVRSVCSRNQTRSCQAKIMFNTFAILYKIQKNRRK